MTNLLEEYDRLIQEANPSAVWENLRDALAQTGVGRVERPFTKALRPRLLLRTFGEEVLRASSILARAALRFCETALKEPALLSAVGLTPEEQELACYPAPPGIGLTRIDGFVSEDRFQIVEWNGGCPAGGAYLDAIAPAFQKSAPFVAFAKKYKTSYSPCAPQVLENLLNRYRAAGGKKEKPSIAVVDFAGLSTSDEHELFRALFAAEGYPAYFVTPTELELKQGALFGPEGVIDIVYRRLVTRDYLPQRQKMPVIAEAARLNAAVIVDPFRAEIVHKKSFLAVLSEPTYQHLFTQEERGVIRAMIPWTRRVLPQKTTDFDGAEVDLIKLALQRQAELVLKPIDNYGGKGVILGWDVDPGLWEGCFAEALQNGQYVLQRRVETPRAPYPIATRWGVVWQDLLEDLCPYLAEDRAQGFLCRATTLSLGNVSAGANPLPVFFSGVNCVVEIKIVYEGKLHTSATHTPSGSVLATDAPRDNEGLGETFSPTDLVATALGSCMLTTMAIFAKRHQIAFEGATATVRKHMVTDPVRRIGALEVVFEMPAGLRPEHRAALERSAHTCPVHKSMHPEVSMPISFVYPE